MDKKRPEESRLLLSSEIVGGIQAILSKGLTSTNYEFQDGISCVLFDDGSSETHFPDGEVAVFKPADS